MNEWMREREREREGEREKCKVCPTCSIYGKWKIWSYDSIVVSMCDKNEIITFWKINK